MRTLRFWIAVLLIVPALLATGHLVASNVGYRIVYELKAPPDAVNGTNWLALPYKNKPGLIDAEDLFNDLGGAAFVESIARFDSASDSFETFTGGPGNNFTLTAGEGLRVVMKSTVQYEIFGSHDAQYVVPLPGFDVSPTGSSWISLPYNAESTTASALRDEIGPSAVQEIQRYIRSTGAYQVYSGSSADFSLERGQAYQIIMKETIQYVPGTTY